MEKIIRTERLFLREMNNDDFMHFIVCSQTKILCGIIHTHLMKLVSING